MRTLDTFYQSKDWRNLMRIIKAERLDERGQLICESCGRSIAREYECIGHHVIHLTDENVNDVMVALNPENIQLVHHKCHNLIHEKFKYKGRQIYLVYGPPLSGKTTFVKDSMNEGDLMLDIDSIWQCVSGCERYIKPKRLNAVVFSIRDTILEAVRYRTGKWANAYVVGGYPLSGERERLVKELGAREVFIDCSREECLNRLELCEDARDKKEWRGYIEDWFERYSPPLRRHQGGKDNCRGDGISRRK